jgi:hypothetical protein
MFLRVDFKRFKVIISVKDSISVCMFIIFGSVYSINLDKFLNSLNDISAIAISPSVQQLSL